MLTQAQEKTDLVERLSGIGTVEERGTFLLFLIPKQHLGLQVDCLESAREQVRAVMAVSSALVFSFWSCLIQAGERQFSALSTR